MMLDNLRPDHHHSGKPKLCTLPNGYPTSPHTGVPQSNGFPMSLPLKITRDDHVYHLKSSNFSTSLVGRPFFDGFGDDPSLHERSPDVS